MAKREEVKEVTTNINPSYDWSVGYYMERFIKEFKSNKIFGVRCPACDKVYIPPRMICEQCFKKLSDWVEVSSEGSIISYTIGHVELDNKFGGLKEPIEPNIIALIHLDGSDSHIVHQIKETSTDEIRISMRVMAVWAKDPKGYLTDLCYFKPI